MERFSRQALAALLSAAAGPLAALAAVYVVAPAVLGGTVENPDYLGDWIVGAVLSLLILGGVAAFFGAAATLAAFVLTDCPHALVAWALSVGTTVLWSQVLDQSAVSWPAYVLALGVAPGVVRLGFGLLPQAGLSAPTTHIAKN